MTDPFERLSPFLQEYIWRKNWTEMRDIQVAACDILFDTDDNLLLASGTASGKTEAAFLPILTLLDKNPSSSIGVLYISPLKALINDQFYRLDDLLRDADIPVTKWHGDVSQNIKNKIVKNPQGILQTTPESLEAMLMRKKSVAISLFSDLRYVIIDEVHYFMSNDRGIQLICLLERLQRLIESIPRRVGLSATLGEYSNAEKWLNSGTNRNCSTPKISGQPRSLKLSLESFRVKGDKDEENYFRYLYDHSLNKRCIIFANSRSEAEKSIAELKAIAQKCGTKDIYFVHHGSLSAGVREYTETKMKESDDAIVTGATVTLELGIDIGKLERIIQTGAPFSVSSFVQRLGRTGRRGNPSEMWFAFREEENKTDRVFYKEINWDFLKCLALIQLYLEERWIEPAGEDALPYGLLYHQTMSYLAAMGEVSLPQLAQNILTLSPFKDISQDEYRVLLKYLVENKQLELTERNGVIVGLEGEKEISSYEFFAVFESSVEYAVKSEGQEIGTVQEPYPIGEVFALAGRTWRVIAVSKEAHEIFVEQIKGKSEISWISAIDTNVHTKVMKKMLEILLSPDEYRYLGENAKIRLSEMRELSKMAGITDSIVIRLSDGACAVFPWIGTKAMLALSYALEQRGHKNSLYDAHGVPLFLEIRWSKPIDELKRIVHDIVYGRVDKHGFFISDIKNFGGKFAEFIPDTLLRRQYIEDCVDVVDMQSNIAL